MNQMTLAGMLPGTPIRSLDELKNLPEHTVVLRRSGAQPSFRTAWTLTVLDAQTRYWSSASWRAQHSDEDLFNDAIESMVILYRPLETFAIGLLDGAGYVERAAPMEPFPTLEEAARLLPQRAAENPMSAILHRIDPGEWNIYEGAMPA